MKQILVTGATGTIGSEVIRYLSQMKSECGIIAAVRTIKRAMKILPDDSSLSFRQFDFENTGSFKSAFDGIDVLFLLRPPHISDVQTYFQPLLESAKRSGVGNILFLSVQGAKSSKMIPHNKIEQLIKDLGINFIFLRPSYFMQNLTTTLLDEIVKEKNHPACRQCSIQLGRC